MSSQFSNLLTSLIRHRGVTGCMIVGETDGLIVDSSRKARSASAAAGFGDTGFFELDADGGRVCAAGRNELVLVVVAESRVNVGLIRVEMLRALEAFA